MAAAANVVVLALCFAIVCAVKFKDSEKVFTSVRHRYDILPSQCKIMKLPNCVTTQELCKVIVWLRRLTGYT